MKPKIRAVIFDMDGLMLDTESIAVRAYQAAGAKLGVNFPTEFLHSLIGLTSTASDQAIKSHFGKSVSIQKLDILFWESYHQEIREKGIGLKTGIVELLNFLQNNALPCAVGTSTETKLAEKELALVGLAQYFQFIVGGDQVVSGKPSPDIYLRAAELLELAAQDCLVIEDSENGVRAAHAAGMQTIIVPDLKEPSAEIKALANTVCRSLVEVRSLLADSASLFF